MKKTILLLFYFFCLTQSFSQIYYSNYLNETSEWRNYDYSFDSSGTSVEIFTTNYFDGTAVFNGYVYNKSYSIRLTKTTYFSTFITPTSITDFYFGGYGREDNSGKFYVYDPINNTETVYFDNQLVLNAVIGDFFPIYNTSCVVENINTLNLGSTPLIHIDGVTNSLPSGFIEGIGYVGNPCDTNFEYEQYLNCYSKNGIDLQLGTLDCNSFPVALRGGQLANSDFSKQNNKFTLSPNPTINTLTITNIQNQIINELNIYNTLGQLIETFIKPNETLDVSNLQSGTYFLKIVTERGVSSQKFIKE